MSKKVAVIMGSDSDWPSVKAACTQLQAFGIPFEAHILSAHRTPAAAASFARSARENGFGVIICAAGMAAHLAGAFAANTTPVSYTHLDVYKRQRVTCPSWWKTAPLPMPPLWRPAFTTPPAWKRR